MARRFFLICTECGKEAEVVVLDDLTRVCEDCLEKKLSTDEDVFVIYEDGGLDDASLILGYIKGTELDAFRCCEVLEKQQSGGYNNITYEAVEDLSKLITK